MWGRHLLELYDRRKKKNKIEIPLSCDGRENIKPRSSKMEVCKKTSSGPGLVAEHVPCVLGTGFDLQHHKNKTIFLPDSLQWKFSI